MPGSWPPDRPTTAAEMLLYPRLPREEGLKLIGERRELGVADLRQLGLLTHPFAAPAPTGGTPAKPERLAIVQNEIRSAAAKAGFPNPLRRGEEQSFDRPCGTALFQAMGIVPADAASEDVWTFLTLVVVPEIGPWRFPERKDERLLGKPRNCSVASGGVRGRWDLILRGPLKDANPSARMNSSVSWNGQSSAATHEQPERLRRPYGNLTPAGLDWRAQSFRGSSFAGSGPSSHTLALTPCRTPSSTPSCKKSLIQQLRLSKIVGSRTNDNQLNARRAYQMSLDTDGRRLAAAALTTRPSLPSLP